MTQDGLSQMSLLLTHLVTVTAHVQENVSVAQATPLGRGQLPGDIMFYHGDFFDSLAYFASVDKSRDLTCKEFPH